MSRLASMLGFGKRSDEHAGKEMEREAVIDSHRATPAGSEVGPAIEHQPPLDRGLGQREAVPVLMVEDLPPLNEFPTERTETPPASPGGDEADPLSTYNVPPSFPGSYASMEHGGAWGKQKTTPGTALGREVNPHQYIASPTNDDVVGGQGGTLPEGDGVVAPGPGGQWTGDGRNWGGLTDWKKVGSAAAAKGLGSGRPINSDPTYESPHTPNPSADFQFPPASDPPDVSRHPFEPPPQQDVPLTAYDIDHEFRELLKDPESHEGLGRRGGVEGAEDAPLVRRSGSPLQEKGGVLPMAAMSGLAGAEEMAANEPRALAQRTAQSDPLGLGGHGSHQMPQMDAPHGMGVTDREEAMPEPRGMDLNVPRHEEPLAEPHGMGLSEPGYEEPLSFSRGIGLNEPRHEEPLSGQHGMGLHEPRHEEHLTWPGDNSMNGLHHEEPLSRPRGINQHDFQGQDPTVGLPLQEGGGHSHHHSHQKSEQILSGSHTPASGVPFSSSAAEEEAGVARVVVIPPADLPFDGQGGSVGQAQHGNTHVSNNVENAEHMSSSNHASVIALKKSDVEAAVGAGELTPVGTEGGKTVYVRNKDPVPRAGLRHSLSQGVARAQQTLADVSHHLTAGARGSPRSVLGTAFGKLEAVTRRMLKGGDTLWRETFPDIPADETLHKWFACLLSTEAGAVPGVLHVSDRYLAFCSDRAMQTAAEKNEMGRPMHQWSYYKVLLPLADVRLLDSKEHATSERDRSLQVVMSGGEEFWFFGFVHYNDAALATRHFWSLMKQSATRGGVALPSTAEETVLEAGTPGSA